MWDRLFRTFRLRDDPRTINFGLDGFDGERSSTLTGMLASPVRKSPAGAARSGAGEPGTNDPAL